MFGLCLWRVFYRGVVEQCVLAGSAQRCGFRASLSGDPAMGHVRCCSAALADSKSGRERNIRRTRCRTSSQAIWNERTRSDHVWHSMYCMDCRPSTFDINILKAEGDLAACMNNFQHYFAADFRQKRAWKVLHSKCESVPDSSEVLKLWL